LMGMEVLIRRLPLFFLVILKSWTILQFQAFKKFYICQVKLQDEYTKVEGEKQSH
jgi:hypothetical protein